MRYRIAAMLAGAVLLFFIQALSALVGGLFALAHRGLWPEVRPLVLGAGLGTVALAVLLPVLPLARWRDRAGALALAAQAAALCRIGVSVPHASVQLVAAALTVGAGGLFLATAVGQLERRALAAAAAGALLADQLLRMAGGSWDLSGRPLWIPVQVLLALGVFLLVAAFERTPERDAEEGGTLERRSGGLRLRGALALAAILFLEQAVLGRASVLATLTGVPYGAVGVLLAGVAMGAVATLLAASGPPGRSRTLAVGLAVLAGVGALLPRWIGGWAGVLVGAAGHGAALLLLARALNPASGRRRGWTTAGGVTLFVLLAGAHAATFFPAFTLPRLAGGAPWVAGAATVLLALAMLLSPVPLPSPPRLRRPAWGAALAAVLLVTLAFAVRLRSEGRTDSLAVPPLRVATWNVRMALGEDWVFDPERIARGLEASGADVVALQEVPAGLMVAGGVDLGLWLGQRLGMRVVDLPGPQAELGGALLTRLPLVDVTADLEPGPFHRQRHAVVRVAAGADTIAILPLHLDADAGASLAVLTPLLRTVGDGPVLVLGDLNTDASDAAVHRLRAEGFTDAFAAAGGAPGPTARAGGRALRVDWIWVRGLGVSHAVVLPGRGSDHDIVAAAIQPLPR